MDNAQPEIARKSWIRRALRHVERMLAILGVVLAVYLLFFDVAYVTSSSMSPTLIGCEKGPGDWLLSERITYHLRKPRRWELVSFHQEYGILVAKRVVALPGETVAIVDGRVCINGEPQAMPAAIADLKYMAMGCVRKGASHVCEDRAYFVLGDDTRDSLDSRFEGDVAEDRIIARPVLRLWPLNRIGLVNP